MASHIRAAIRTATAGIDTSSALVVIGALRNAATEGVIAWHQANKAEKLICRFRATNDNWLNELLDIMDDRIKTRPALW